jgi:nitrous oxide reductase accessory protein NosL
MKKSLLIASLLALALAACGKKEEAAPAPAEAPKAEAPAEAPKADAAAPAEAPKADAAAPAAAPAEEKK